jgi:hypothetical protein
VDPGTPVDRENWYTLSPAVTNSGYIDSHLGHIAFFPYENTPMSWDPNLLEVRGYNFPLSKLLNSDIEKTKANLEFITLEVLKHLKNEMDHG